MNIIQHPSRNRNARPKNKHVGFVIIHATAGINSLAHLCNIYLAKRVSAHYLIEKDGVTYQLVQESDAAWHAGACAFEGAILDMNGISVGIEIENRNTGTDLFPQAQWDATVLLTRNIVCRYDLPRTHVVRHKDVAIPKGRKSDPAENFEWKRFLDEVYQFITYRVTGDGLRIRKEPNTLSDIVTKLELHDRVAIDREEAGWGRLGDGRGWVSMQFLA